MYYFVFSALNIVTMFAMIKGRTYGSIVIATRTLVNGYKWGLMPDFLPVAFKSSSCTT